METIKLIHVTTALLSIGGFIARGVLMLKASPLLGRRWVRILPHVNDTLLLVAGILLVSQWGWGVLGMPWLQAKLVALLVYILLGAMALHGGFSRRVHAGAWGAALLVFAYIVLVAISKDPLPLL